MTEAAVYARKLAIFAKIVHRKDKVDKRELNTGEQLEVEESIPSPQQ
jgi:hypothetical protein